MFLSHRLPVLRACLLPDQYCCPERQLHISWQLNRTMCQSLGQHTAQAHNCTIVRCCKSLWILTAEFCFLHTPKPPLCSQWKCTHPHTGFSPTASQIQQRHRCNWFHGVLFSCQSTSLSLLIVVQPLSLSLCGILSTFLAECHVIPVICTWGYWTGWTPLILSSLSCSRDTVERTVG